MTHRWIIAAALLAALTAPAAAEVRFGKNVRIGGHDVSNQTFNAKRRGLYIIYNGKPAKPGCRWRSNGDGSRTKVCHLQRKRR
jgi:hypothetical protein